jgi:hypothetical protein
VPSRNARADNPTPDLSKLAPGRLLALYRAILAELRSREVIRSGNAPAGDYAEFLVREATGGELAPNSEKGWDIRTPHGEELQVKTRVVTNTRNRGERQLSVFRSWDFKAAVIVLFDDEFRVWRAARLPVETVESAASPDKHVNGFRVYATDELLARGEDWTQRLKDVVH